MFYSYVVVKVVVMKKIVIEGNKRLSGTIKIGGAKNSVVALIPAAIMASGSVEITNVPNISDKDALLEILHLLNAKVSTEEKKIVIDAMDVKNAVISEDLSSKLRASYYFMGALLGRFKHVEIYFPGGCNIGARPIDLHLKGFEALGVKIEKDESKYILSADDLLGADIHLDFASVGATINIMLAAAMAKGKTVIHNAAKEVEIINIADLLNRMGANIKGAGTETIEIEGVHFLHGAKIEVIPDRIEAGTYIIMGALLGNNLTIDGIVEEHLLALLNKLKEMGVRYSIDGAKITLNRAENLQAVDVKTEVYPGFPTDLGQPMAVLLTQGVGTSTFHETIFENRMGHMPYLNKMGANIDFSKDHAVIKGKTLLHGEEIFATDLRSGAALVTAGLIAEGITEIHDVEYILRGYERIISKLSDVGANIKIVEI